MLVMTTSVRLVYLQDRHIKTVFFILTIHCGMVKVVVQLAHAAHSTIHHGFVNSYLSQLMMIWKYDYAELIQQLLKTLLLNWWKYTPSRQIATVDNDINFKLYMNMLSIL